MQNVWAICKALKGKMYGPPSKLSCRNMPFTERLENSGKATAKDLDM